MTPDYGGSEDYEAVPIPYVHAAGSNHIPINRLGNKDRVNLIPSPIRRGGLTGDAEGSPVVDDEGDANQFTGGVLVFYKF